MFAAFIFLPTRFWPRIDRELPFLAIALQKSSVVASDAISTAPVLSSSADLALQDTGALAAAEYGRLAVREHPPLFSGPGAASAAAGPQCISAGAPPQPLTRSRS